MSIAYVKYKTEQRWNWNRTLKWDASVGFSHFSWWMEHLQSLYWPVVVKDGLSQKVKLSIYHVLDLYAHELWLITGRQVPGCLQAGQPPLRSRVRSLGGVSQLGFPPKRGKLINTKIQWKCWTWCDQFGFSLLCSFLWLSSHLKCQLQYNRKLSPKLPYWLMKLEPGGYFLVSRK